MSFRQLQQIISSSSDQLKGELCYNNNYGIIISLNGYKEVLWSDEPFVVEDWPTLNWQGNLLFHRGHGTVYLVKGHRDFDNAIYRSRLQGYQKMVGWASSLPVGFTTDEKIEEVWGHLLINPWLIKSTRNRWRQRIEVFAALNEFDPARWPLSLLLENWDAVRKIIF